MAIAIGIVRLVLSAVLVGLGVWPTLLLALVPVRYRGARLSHWFLTLLTRIFNRIYDLRFICEHPEQLQQHRGLIFPNHSSYLDPIALLAVTPVRLLGAAEVSRQPFLGWFGTAIGAVWVDRSSKQSRRAARNSISAVLKNEPYPPVALFPEGRLGPGTELMPFRHGAFELAIENQVAFLPVALRYKRPDIVTWYGGSRHESLVAAVWRLARHLGRISVEVIPLEPWRPSRDDDPAILAILTQRRIEQVLGMAPASVSLEDVPPARFEEVQPR